jgi:prepilin-type processing-associated H-X9-DG protein
VELLVVIAIIGILVALLLPAIQAARAAAQRTQCQNNLKQIGLACLNYESSKGALPEGSLVIASGGSSTPSGLAWTVLILPFIEDAQISEQALEIYTKATNPDAYGGAMDSLNKLLPASYLCPSDTELPYQIEKFLNPDRRAMSYAGVMGSYYARTGRCSADRKTAGEYCVILGNPATDSYGPNNFDGLLIQGWPVPLKQCTDGLSKTLMIGERWYQVRAWMAGAFWRDLQDPRGNPRDPKSTRPDGPQPRTAFFSCKNITDKWLINHSPFDYCYVDHVNDYSTLGLNPPRTGGDRPTLPESIRTTRNKISVNDLPWGSFHSGGANFVQGDGSVKFLPDEIDFKIFLAMGSRNGDETIDSN